MSRSYAAVYTSIWTDADFRALPVDAQQLYFLVISQPDMAYTGVVPFTLRRWVSYASGATTSSVRGALKALEHANFVVVDEDTEELWVRSFIRHNKVNAQPNLRKLMLRQYDAIQSVDIKRVVWGQLHEDDQKTRSEPLPKGLPKPIAEPIGDAMPEPPGIGIGTGVTSVVSIEPIPKSSSAPEPNPSPDEDLLDKVWSELAERRMRASPTPVSQPEPWKRKVRMQVMELHRPKARAFIAAGLKSPQAIADKLEPPPPGAHAPAQAQPRVQCEDCGGSGWTLDDNAAAVPCGTCQQVRV